MILISIRIKVRMQKMDEIVEIFMLLINKIIEYQSNKVIVDNRIANKIYSHEYSAKINYFYHYSELCKKYP